ncbi:hypothetical protein TARUN_9574 [Trichoderma arundinaceum]|uniref:Uncharacterized protein n=1 Tax=Trichoderma arundinaceum TaxID=490622 RepID=A0A395N9V2_TRIAR|nr:hypothetical protein TARUN_9574 [Trichoderma arundinaceum]
MNRAPTTQLMGETIAEEIEDGGYSEEGLSSICLRINTSVLVSSHNNLVCLSDPPASHANAIAKAVVQALRENSSGQCGIPMIDEDGRPRPVKIEVDAGVTVEGSGNIIGNESVVRQFLTRGISRKRSADPDDVFTASAPPAQRRRRSLGNDNDDNSNSNNNNGSEGNSGISP